MQHMQQLNPTQTARKPVALEIPFPFGTTESCYLDSSFLITCNQTSPSAPHTPTPYLPQTTFTVLNISLNGELRISTPVATGCYDRNGTRISKTTTKKLNLTQFSISSSRNKLRAVGCNTLGGVAAVDSSEGKNYNTGCVSLCYRPDDPTNGSCTGAGCCQISLPAQGLSIVSYGFFSVFANHNDVFDFNPCGYAFVAKEGAYSFSSTDLVKIEHDRFPVVLDWAVGNWTCREAQKNASTYACKADNSTCNDSLKGYLCNYSVGFRGNPYLLNGCQGIISYLFSLSSSVRTLLKFLVIKNK